MNSKNIAIVDIDGCLTDYPKVFLSWVSKHRGISFSSLEAMKNSMSRGDYEALKHSYRISGVKRNLPVYPYAKETLEALKRNGMGIWIITSRPKWEPVFSDTKYWLNTNDVPYDELFFVGNKQDFMKQIPEKRIRIIIEDEHDTFEFALNNPGVSILYFNKGQRVVTNKKITVVNNWKEIEDCLRRDHLL